jgi:hypothetical protein
MNEIAAYGSENHIIGTGIRMVGSENGLPEFLEREINRDNAFNLVTVRTYRHAEGAHGIMIVDDAGVEVAEGGYPARFAGLHGLLIPVFFEILEFWLEFTNDGVTVVDSIDREILSVLRECVRLGSNRTAEYALVEAHDAP